MKIDITTSDDARSPFKVIDLGSASVVIDVGVCVCSGFGFYVCGD